MKRPIKKHLPKINNKLVGIIFILGFATIASVLIFRALAAPSTATVEPEKGSITSPATVCTDSNASGGSCVRFGSGFVHPGVVYTQADINAWSTSSPEYTRLANSGAASLTKTPIAFGTQINNGGDPKNQSNELNAGFRDLSGAAKIQAVLWAADGNSIRKQKAIDYLSQYRTVTSIEWDSIEQYRLVAGWSCTNLAQAAEIINYSDTQFQRFLKDVCYPIMDWPNTSNWHASFADSKLQIAAYLGDEALWADAKAYFYERIKQTIFDSVYDGNKVHPLHSEDNAISIFNSSGVKIGSTVPPRLHAPPGTPKFTQTQAQWGKEYDPDGNGQILSDYSINPKYGAVDGMNGERLRDLGHVSMGQGALMHAIRTLKAQGESNTPEYIEAYARLLAAYSYHSQRVLTYAQTGVIPAPVPVDGDGGGARFQGYFGAKKLFGYATPQSVLNMLARSEVKTYSAAGANHMIAEAFADQ